MSYGAHVPRSGPLGEIDVQAMIEISVLTVQQARFNALWATTVGSRTTVPTAFVIDLLGGFFEDIIKPYAELRNQMVSELPQLAAAINTAIVELPFIMWERELQPVLQRALDIKRGGILVMPISGGGQSPRRWISDTIDALKEGYAQLADIRLKTYVLRSFLAAKGFFETVEDMFRNLADAIAAGAEALYKPVRTLTDFMNALFKVSIAGAGLYVGWMIFKPKPKQNPGRRRRRR